MSKIKVDGAATEMRIAYRAEGDFFNAYFAHPNTLDGAIPLGSVRMSIIKNHAPARERFRSLIDDAVHSMFREATGARSRLVEAARIEEQPAKIPEGMMLSPEYRQVDLPQSLKEEIDRLDPVKAIAFSLKDEIRSEATEFLDLWMHGDFDQIRQEWPEFFDFLVKA